MPASSGDSQAADPAAPCTNAESPRPTGLPMPHQMLAASTNATASQSSPIPSRRCSGSRSRALRPIRRAPKPTAPPATIQHAATAWPSQLTRIRIGSRDRTEAGWRPRAVLPLRLAVVRERDEELGRLAVVVLGRLVVGRPEVLAGLFRAGPGGSARTEPLGARVAMMPTVTNAEDQLWEAGRVLVRCWRAARCRRRAGGSGSDRGGARAAWARPLPPR